MERVPASGDYTSLTLTVPRRRPVCGIKRVQSTIESERDNPTYPASSNKTDFLTGDGRAGDGGRLTDMLVVTTTVGMVDGVHRHTTSTRPAVALSLELVERTAGLEQRLVDTATAGDDADRRTC